MSAPTVTTDSDGNRVETYPEQIDISGNKYTRIVTYYPEVPMSTIAASGASIGVSIGFMLLFAILIWVGYLISKGIFGDKFGRILYALFLVAMIGIDINDLVKLDRKPVYDRLYNSNTGTTIINQKNPLNYSQIQFYFLYQWNMGQLLAELFALIIIGRVILTGSPPKPTNQGASTNQSAQAEGGGKRKSTLRRRT